MVVPSHAQSKGSLFYMLCLSIGPGPQPYLHTVGPQAACLLLSVCTSPTTVSALAEGGCPSVDGEPCGGQGLGLLSPGQLGSGQAQLWVGLLVVMEIEQGND